MIKGKFWVVVAAFILLSVQACALSILVGPKTVEFDDVMAGQTWEKTVFVSVKERELVGFEASLEGDAGGMITLLDDGRKITGPASFKVKRGEGKQFTVKVDAPAGTQEGTYSGSIKVRSVQSGQASAGNSATLNAAVEVPVVIKVTNVQKPSSQVVGATVADSEAGGKMGFTVITTNNGNVDVKMQVTAELLDSSGATLAEKDSEVTVERADGDQEFVVELKTGDLPVGTYRWRASASGGGGDYWSEEGVVKIVPATKKDRTQTLVIIIVLAAAAYLMVKSKPKHKPVQQAKVKKLKIKKK